jgi:hypothetical protein
MGIFTNLFSPNVQAKPSSKKDSIVLLGAAKFEHEVRVGEEHQATLEALCGKRVPRGVNRFESARLFVEDKNRNDINAVRVEIKGKSVGYLAPVDAVAFREHLSGKGLPKAIGECQAAIRGGWISSDGRKGDYEVWLDLHNL